jgi:hypothetical protein
VFKSWKERIQKIVDSKHLIYKEQAIYEVVEDLIDEYTAKVASHNRLIKLGNDAYVKGINHQRAYTLRRLKKLQERVKKSG